MATTYLVLSNRILRELNEVEMTSTTFSSSRGIQTAVKDFINKSIHDIYNEVPNFLYYIQQRLKFSKQVMRNMHSHLTCEE